MDCAAGVVGAEYVAVVAGSGDYEFEGGGEYVYGVGDGD